MNRGNSFILKRVLVRVLTRQIAVGDRLQGMNQEVLEREGGLMEKGPRSRITS